MDLKLILSLSVKNWLKIIRPKTGYKQAGKIQRLSYDHA